MKFQTPTHNEASCVEFSSIVGNQLSYCPNSYVVTNKGMWIMDTAATSHMCNDLKMFIDPNPLSKL